MRIKKSHIIYSLLIVLLITAIVIALYSYFTDSNFIADAYNNKFGTIDEPDPYHNIFWGQYIFPFLIYSIISVILLFLWRGFIRAIKDRVSLGISNTLKILGDIIIIPFFIIAYLNKFEAFRGTLIGIAALLGTAIGFASTTTIGNLLAGLYLIISRPFIIGDYIIIPDMNTEGVVRELTVNYTKVEQPDSNTAILPNSGLLNKWIYNTRKTITEDIEKNTRFRLRKKSKFVFMNNKAYCLPSILY